MCMVTDYRKILQQKNAIETEIVSLPQGYISHKTIKGKTYAYLQNRVNGKMTSTYIKADEEPVVAKELEKRKKQEETLLDLNHQILTMETEAEGLDKIVFRRMMMVKLSLNMDSMDSMQKEKSISFANAMNAIEGVPASEKMTEDLRQWKNGDLSFLTLFEGTLKRYGFPVGGSL